MGDYIPVYFGAVAVDPTFQARDFPGLEFNYPVRPGTRYLTSGCSVLDGLQALTARKSLGEVRQRIEGGIPPLGEFDSPYFDDLRQRFEPGDFQKATIQEKIEINEFIRSTWGPPLEDQYLILFSSYLKTLDHVLSQVEGDKKFVFVLACPWGP